MKAILLLVILVSLMPGQVVMTLTGPATAAPGTTITLTLNAVPSTSTAAYQWDVGIPAFYTASAITGAAGTSASKTISCTSYFSMCIEYGMNANVIASGVLAAYSIIVPLSASGSASFPLSALLGSDPSGYAVTVTSGAAYTLSIVPSSMPGPGAISISLLYPPRLSRLPYAGRTTASLYFLPADSARYAERMAASFYPKKNTAVTVTQ